MSGHYPTPISTAGSYEDIDAARKKVKLQTEKQRQIDSSQEAEIQRLLEESQESRQAYKSDAVGYNGFIDTSSSSSSSFSSGAELELSVWGYMLSNTTTSLSFLLSKESRCGVKTKSDSPNNIPSETAQGVILKDYNGDNVASSGYLLGRNVECDVVVNDAQISERHFVMFKINTSCNTGPEGGQGPVCQRIYLQDISGRGTYVNSEIVKRNEIRLLLDNDQISPYKQGPSWSFRTTRMKHHSSFEDRFLTGRTLGRGHFAEVHEVTERATGQKFAAKILRKSMIANDETFLQEIGLLMACTHSLITCIRDVFETETQLYLILELAAGGELFDRIIQKGRFSEDETRTIFRQLFAALAYLHSHSIVHRDIKPENILLTSAEGLEIRLADFGLAKIIGNRSATSTLAGTPSYIPPEMLGTPQTGRSLSYSNKVDSWSAGVVLYICLCGFPPFSQELAPPPLKTQIREGRYQFQRPYWDSISDSAIDLVQHLLTVDPQLRISITQAMQHPFMQSISKPLDSIEFGRNSTVDVRTSIKRQRTLLAQLGRPHLPA